MNDEIEIYNQKDSETEIALSYKDYFFSVEFSALDFNIPQKNQFAYMMKGLDQEWIYTGANKRFATYTTLNPGSYVFMVKGSNNDGIWNEKGSSVRITIQPPYWQTWWFRLIIIVLILALALQIHQARIMRTKQRMKNDQLEQELKLKADFTAMLVHELRNPLTAVKGYAELLVLNPDKIDPKRVGKITFDSTEKMINLINDMLDCSKFEAGKMKLTVEKVLLKPLIDEIVEIQDPLMKKKFIHLDWDYEKGLDSYQVNVDPIKIGQVIGNLLSNAIKFTQDAGRISINISLENNHFVEISVSNSGDMIPEEKRQFLFDKYAQLNHKNLTVGTGLGLAVSKMIVEAHGGIIGYRPCDQYPGSTFYFQLP